MANRLTIPGFVNAHSHAFQRALRGRTEALCAKRPLYPGFRGYPTYIADGERG